jgi:hypothetical protein
MDFHRLHDVLYLLGPNQRYKVACSIPRIDIRKPTELECARDPELFKKLYDVEKLCRYGVIYGVVEALDYAMETTFYFDERDGGSYVCDTICRIIVKNNYLDCLKYLHRKGIVDYKHGLDAAKHGSLDCLKYICENVVLEKDDYICAAGLGGQKACLEYLGKSKHEVTWFRSKQIHTRYIFEDMKLRKLENEFPVLISP